MLNRGEAAKYATPVFYQTYNDFDVYIEDTAQGYAKIFADLLSRCMGSSVSLERVFPLGARLTVIAAAERELQIINSRKSVFLVDGDLGLLTGEINPLPQNVVSLPRCCIENFLYDEESIVSVIDEESINLTANQIKDKFDYTGWMERALPPLRELFIVFATARKLGAGIQSVSLGYSSICAGKNGEVDSEKAKKLSDSIILALNKNYGNKKTEEAYLFVNEKINCSSCFLSTYVSAKDFLLPLLVIRLKRICASKASNINLKMRLAKRCSIEPLVSVAKQIKEIIS